MDRREALKRTALLMGGAVFAPNMLGVLQGCSARPENWNPTFFSQKQAKVIEELAQIILPEGETPGAKQVGVPAFIEKMIRDVYTEADQKKIMEGLEAFDEKARRRFGTSFQKCSKINRIALAEQENERLKSLPADERPFFLNVKELTVLGYFTTKTVATEVINHISVPGEYTGCIPYEEIGTVWAER